MTSPRWNGGRSIGRHSARKRYWFGGAALIWPSVDTELRRTSSLRATGSRRACGPQLRAAASHDLLHRVDRLPDPTLSSATGPHLIAPDPAFGDRRTLSSIEEVPGLIPAENVITEVRVVFGLAGGGVDRPEAERLVVEPLTKESRPFVKISPEVAFIDLLHSSGIVLLDLCGPGHANPPNVRRWLKHLNQYGSELARTGSFQECARTIARRKPEAALIEREPEASERRTSGSTDRRHGCHEKRSIQKLEEVERRCFFHSCQRTRPSRTKHQAATREPRRSTGPSAEPETFPGQF